MRNYLQYIDEYIICMKCGKMKFATRTESQMEISA